jgi:hypothetical protein
MRRCSPPRRIRTDPSRNDVESTTNLSCKRLLFGQTRADLKAPQDIDLNRFMALMDFEVIVAGTFIQVQQVARPALSPQYIKFPTRDVYTPFMAQPPLKPPRRPSQRPSASINPVTILFFTDGRKREFSYPAERGRWVYFAFFFFFFFFYFSVFHLHFQLTRVHPAMYTIYSGPISGEIL